MFSAVLLFFSLFFRAAILQPEEMETFHSWLCEALSPMKLQDEAFIGYIESILGDETCPLEEKKDAVLEFLAASTVCHQNVFAFFSPTYNESVDGDL